MGSLAAIGIVKGKPFNPDARMQKILGDAAAIANATSRAIVLNPRESEDFYYYPGSGWQNSLWVGGYNFETPPPQVSSDRRRHSIPSHRRSHARCPHRILLLRNRYHTRNDHEDVRDWLAVPLDIRGFGQELFRWRRKRTK